MYHIIKLINGIRLKKSIVLGIVQQLILVSCIVQLILKRIDFGISYLIMVSISVLLGIISLLFMIKTPICQMNGNCSNMEKIKGSLLRDLKCWSREQRHDYMNIFQIIYGYLQLKKIDKAIEQIKKITNMTTNISKIYNLSILSVSLLIEKKIKEAYNQGVEIICDVTNYIENEFRIVHNEEQLISRLTEIVDYLIGEMYKDSHNGKLFIDISEYKDRLEFVFKGDIDNALDSNIHNILGDAWINNGEIKIIFKYSQMKNVIPEDTIYFSLLNNV